jgi:hypothetical protein
MDGISAAYGWTDNTILDLTIARLRQISQAIAIRLYTARVYEDSRAEWSTKLIATTMALTAQNPKLVKVLLKHISAQSLHATEDPDLEDDSSDSASRKTEDARGPRTDKPRLPPDSSPIGARDLTDNIRDRGRLAEIAALERNRNGSAELLMSVARGRA